jgi:hypothetical protein
MKKKKSIKRVVEKKYTVGIKQQERLQQHLYEQPPH